LAKRAVAPLAAAIRKLCGPQIGAGRKHTAANLLKGVDPDLAAYCTVRGVLGFAASRRTLRAAAMFIAEVLATELLAEAFETSNPSLYRAVVRNAEARGLPPERVGKAVGRANKMFSVAEQWTTGQRLHLGVKLVELAIETLGIVEAYRIREGKKTTTHRLRFTPEIDAWMVKYNAAAALTRPFYLPTLLPPRPWTSPRDSAYYSSVIRGGHLITKPVQGQLDALEKADMAPVYTGLNAIQATPWRVNKRVLAVMQEAWEHNLPGLPLPKRESEPRSVAPQEVPSTRLGFVQAGTGFPQSEVLRVAAGPCSP
jgi:DNA-directed RNA polymerase